MANTSRRWSLFVAATIVSCLIAVPGETHDEKKGCAARGGGKWITPDAKTHVDFSPQHGGRTFSAPNGYHHFEAVFTPPYQVKIYLYDATGQSIQGAFFRGSVALRGEKGRAPSRLTLAPDGTLEAEIPRKTLPFALDARLAYGGPPKGPKAFDQVFKIGFEKPNARLKATTKP